MGKRAPNRKQQKQLNDMQYLLDNNVLAQLEGPKRKKWSLLDLQKVQPLNDKQQDMFECFFQGSHVCAYGSAGTGKTYLALYLGMRDVLDKDQPQTRMIIVRSAVQGRDSGFLPGTIEEKMAIFELPYKDIMASLFKRPSTYDDMKDAHLLTFMPTTAIRGLTWDDAVIVIDEFQNMTWAEFDSVLTRVGTNSRLIICGDIHHQCDLKKHEETGAHKAIKVIKNMPSFATVEFTKDDIVRSAFVKEWIVTREKFGY